MAESTVNEEHFLFMVQDAEVREVLNNALKNSTEDEPLVDLEMHTSRVGSLTVRHGDGVFMRAVTLHEVPTIIETFKSHNHVNLIKSGDIGQAFVVHELIGDEGPQEHILEANLTQLTAMEHSGQLPTEVEAGLTPPMAAGRKSFRMQLNPRPEVVTEVEEQLLALMHGEAPEGWVIEDVAEVYIEEKGSGTGRWVPLSDAPDEFRLPQQQPPQDKG